MVAGSRREERGEGLRRCSEGDEEERGDAVRRECGSWDAACDETRCSRREEERDSSARDERDSAGPREACDQEGSADWSPLCWWWWA